MAGGRPTLYEPEYVDKVVEFCGEGTRTFKVHVTDGGEVRLFQLFECGGMQVCDFPCANDACLQFFHDCLG